MYTLCVIDLQTFFGVKEDSRVVDNIAREIRQAISDDAAILFVEYKNCGDTIATLTDIAKHAGAAKAITVTKTGDDGAEEILEAITKNGYYDNHIKMVGVNTDCCVYRTASGLKIKRQDINIEVIADACDSNWSPDSHRRGIENIRSLGCHITNDNTTSHSPEFIRSIGDPL